MNFKHSGSFIVIAENLIRIGAPVTLAITVLLMCVALFDKSNANEAYIGSFETWEFNSGWQMVTENGNVNVELPASISADYGQTVVLENTLPRGLSDGMNLAIRSTMEDVLIYVNGSLRAEYSSNTVSGSPYYVPSAFVVAKLYEWDSGKDVRMEIHFKARHIISGVKLYYGNNLWFEVIKSAGPVCFIALMTFVLGAVLSFAALFLINSFKVKAARNMGLLVMDLSLWIFSESTMRQIIFLRPSLSQFFSYYLVEMVGVFACLYFDEVQHRHYHKIYVVMESLALLQVFINIILNSIHVADYYVTLGFSHMWTFLCAVVTIINIIIDVRTKRVKEYHITTMGMILFIVVSLSELLGFYLNRFHVFGTEISIAIVFLMAATVVQTIYDEIKNSTVVGTTLIVLLILLVVAIIVRNIRVVPQATCDVLERLGKFSGVKHAGLYIKIPLIERMVARVSLKEQVYDFPPQAVITKDNVTMQIDSVVYAKVFDPKLYIYGIENPITGLQNLAATTLRSIIGEMELDQTLTSRESINAKMEAVLDEATDAWGIKVTRVEIKNINPPAEIEAVMTKQMRAERERRQTVLEAQAPQEAVVARAKGDKEAKVMAAEAEKEAQIALAEGRAKSILLVYEAEAEGLRKLSQTQISDSVLNLRRIEAMKDVADGQATKIFVPTDVAGALISQGVRGEALDLKNTMAPAGVAKEKTPVEKDPCVDDETSRAGRMAAAYTQTLVHNMSETRR